MFIDTIHGTIERRVLLNYRIQADVLASALPEPYRPKTYAGWGVGGICMIRFKGLRPLGVPASMGLGSENAAHRIAVSWNQDGQEMEGVYIPRRDTNSWFNKTLGGTVFPGIFNRSQFTVKETQDSVSIEIVREDGGVEAAFDGEATDALPSTSIFPSLNEATNFFSLGATGYSATNEPEHYHGMELKTLDWSIEPLRVHRAVSCFFADKARFPEGSVDLDCALLMRNIAHEWHSRPDLYLSGDRAFLTSKPE
jgi:Uncharacterized conserved protein (COG2071)